MPESVGDRDGAGFAWRDLRGAEAAAVGAWLLVGGACLVVALEYADDVSVDRRKVG